MWIRKRGQTNRFSKCRSELGRWGMVFPDRRKCICRERWPWKRAAYPPALRAHSAPVAYGWVLRARHECWAGLPHSEGEVQRCPWEGSLVNVNKYCRHVFYIFYIDKYYILIYNLRNSGRPTVSNEWRNEWKPKKEHFASLKIWKLISQSLSPRSMHCFVKQFSESSFQTPKSLF